MRKRITAVVLAAGLVALPACDDNGDPTTAAPPPATSGTTPTVSPTPTKKPKPLPKPPSVMPMRTASAAPMSTLQSVTKEMLRRTRKSASKPVGKLSRRQVDGVRRSLVRYLARQHAYRDRQCDHLAPDEAFLNILSPNLRAAITNPRDDFKEHAEEFKEIFSYRVASSDRTCEHVRWQAPGSVVGPQKLRFSRGKHGADLTATYAGEFGYVFKDHQGRPELYRTEFRAIVFMNATKSGGRIVNYAQASANLYRGWFHGLLPHGYDRIMSGGAQLERASDDAWRQVQQAVKRTSRWPAAMWTEQSTSRSLESGKKSRHTHHAVVAFRDGHVVLREDKHRREREVILDHGKTDLSWHKERPTPQVNASIPRKAAHWRAWDPTTPWRGTEYDTSPFVRLELLRLATSVAARPCDKQEKSAKAQRCYLVRTPATNAAYSQGITTRWGWGALTMRHPWMDAQVGIDAQGRLVSLARSTKDYFLGEPGESETWRVTLSDFTAKVPPRPKRPRANLIAPDGSYWR